jgi:hypothetical protein
LLCIYKFFIIRKEAELQSVNASLADKTREADGLRLKLEEEVRVREALKVEFERKKQDLIKRIRDAEAYTQQLEEEKARLEGSQFCDLWKVQRFQRDC